MKSNILWMFAALLMVTAGCAKQESFTDGSCSHELAAEVETFSPQTKIGFKDIENKENQYAQFFWTYGDEIAVGSSELKLFKTYNKTGDASATFKGANEAKGYALYPYKWAKDLYNDEFTYTFSNVYTYTAVDSDFFGEVSAPMPMWGRIEDGKVNFKHLGGILVFRYPELKTGENQTFTITADKRISGDFTTTLAEGAYFETEDTSVEGEKQVTIRFSLSNDRAAVFYIPVPVGTYSFDIKITDAEGEVLDLKSYKNIQVRRANIRYTTLSESNIEGGEGEGEGSESEPFNIVVEELKESSSATIESIEADENGTAGIQLPKKSYASGEHTLTISSIDSKVKTIVISEDESDQGNSIENIVVKLPAETQVDMTIDLPNTTVTLTPENTGSLLIDRLTASTADNTLILESGITVNNLIIAKGNVKVRNGAKIANATRDAANISSESKVIFNGAIPQDMTKGENVRLITVEDHFLEAIANGGTVTVEEDIVLTKSVTISKENTVILNLNGKTISQSKECTASYGMINNNGTLTITGNGKLSFTDTSKGGGSEWGSYTIYNSGILTVDNGIIEHLGSTGDWGNDRPTDVPIDNHAGKVTINDGTIRSPQFRSLRDFTAGGEITINGGTFEGQIWMQGLGEGSSSLTITGGNFSPTAGYDGSSIYITNSDNDIILNISGGYFNTKIGCADVNKPGVKGKITGGIFTSTAKTNTNPAIIAEGYDFHANPDGTFTLKKSE